MAMIRTFLLLLLMGTASACSLVDPYSESFYDREAESILPSEDPLVLALFEHKLNKNDISYKRNYQGHYSAVDPEDAGKLISIGKKMHKKSIQRESIKVGQNCASRRLQGYLREEGALFVFAREDDGYYLHVRAKDYAAANVQQRLTQFQAECAADLEE